MFLSPNFEKFPFPIVAIVWLHLISCSVDHFALNSCEPASSASLSSVAKKVKAVGAPLPRDRSSGREREHIVAGQDNSAYSKYVETRYLMGTFMAMELSSPELDKPELHQMSEELFAVVARIEDEISHYRSASDVSIVNNGTAYQTFFLKPYACLFVRESLYIAKQTGGLIDITVSSGDGGVGYRNLRLADCRLTKLHDSTTIDPSGLGKGFALDLLESKFRSLAGSRCVYAFVNFGMSSIGYLGADSCPRWERVLSPKKLSPKKLVHGNLRSGALLNGENGEELGAEVEGGNAPINLITNHYLTTSHSKNIINPLHRRFANRTIGKGKSEEGSGVPNTSGYEESAITTSAIVGEALVKVKILSH